jgi:hypothetical protein
VYLHLVRVNTGALNAITVNEISPHPLPTPPTVGVGRGRGENEGGHAKEINAFALVKSISLDQKMIKESANL